MAFRDAATGTTNVALLRVQTLYAPSQKHCCLLHPVGDIHLLVNVLEISTDLENKICIFHWF